MSAQPIRFIDLFAGIGGFHLGLTRASNLYQCVYSNEWDKYANSIYRKHFGECDLRDITTVYSGDIPDHDLLVGGFPCQAFSVAGKRGGFEDTRGTLFFEIARILRDKRPRYLLLENVKGLLTHDNGKTFQTILGVLADLGYDVQWQVLNSKNFGVPQNRERVFIVGHLGGEPRPEVFPITESDRRYLSSQRQSQSEGKRLRGDNPSVATTLAARDYKGGGNLIQLNNPVHSNDRIYDPEGISPTLNTMQGGRRQPFVAMRWVRTEKGKEARRQAQQNGKDYTPFNGGHRTLEPAKEDIAGTITSQSISKDSLLGAFAVAERGRYNEDGIVEQQLEPRFDGLTNTLTSVEKDNRVFDGVQIRRLTPTECERLQGFPDGWTLPLSDTQRYKTLGNAVTVNVIEFLGTKLLDSIHRNVLT